MKYVSIQYSIMVVITLALYYIFPQKIRWVILLGASGCFYYLSVRQSAILVIFCSSIIISYFSGLLIQKLKKAERHKLEKAVLVIGIIASALPLIVSKFGDFFLSSIAHKPLIEWILPVGLSFYSLQIISYLVDIYRGKIKPQKNIFKYGLFVSFFPIIIQGPILRYDQLEDQLIEGHSYKNENLMNGIQLVLWGLFLKYLIADKASVFVDEVFDNYTMYSGVFILMAGILFSVQLYADFLSCTTISQGIAEMFGIYIADNFKRPYFSVSIKDFWRRWHISLSSWLKDYVYIPCGGNRKGIRRKYVNLVITFAISGIWHGGRWKYLFWGLMHAGYQIVGEMLSRPRKKFFEIAALGGAEARTRKFIETISTSFLVMIAWIIFRADTLKTGIKMIISVFTSFNPWVLTNNSLFRLGLSQKEFEVLSLAILVLLIVSFMQEKGIKVRVWFNRQNTLIRWIIYLCTIWSIWIFGTYGYGFDAADFIYGGF